MTRQKSHFPLRIGMDMYNPKNCVSLRRRFVQCTVHLHTLDNVRLCAYRSFQKYARQFAVLFTSPREQKNERLSKGARCSFFFSGKVFVVLTFSRQK